MDIIQIPCSNFNPNRDGDSISAIIIHGTAGGTSAEGIARFFQSTEGGSNPVAAHYIIGQDGSIVQCVQEKDGAWANGSSKWNDSAVSIEHVKISTDNSDILTSIQQNESFKLVRDIMSRYPAISVDTILPHSAVYNTACPGPYPWNELRAFLKGGYDLSASQRAQAVAEWTNYWIQLKLPSPPTGSGIFNSWLTFKIRGNNFGPPITWEYPNVDWQNNPIIQQDFAHASCEYNNGVSRWFDSRGEIV